MLLISFESISIDLATYTKSDLGVMIITVWVESGAKSSYTWSDPADPSLDKQDTIDACYRMQLTPEIPIGPTFEAIFYPVRYPDEDSIVRARVAL